MSSLNPRVVLVTRQTELEELLAKHATRGQAEFFLNKRGQSLEFLTGRHQQQKSTVRKAKAQVPGEWSIADVSRPDLDRFFFSDDDIVVAIGQDGLVANLAKYLSGQPVIGISPDPARTEGVLTAQSVEDLPAMLVQLSASDIDIQRRTMVEARLDTGQSIAALNEVFIGHRSHQSARYLIRCNGAEEYQSSSGIIVSTGTGLTGWARSILTATNRTSDLMPEDRSAAFFAREPWPSKTTGCELGFGQIDDTAELAVTSQMNEGGVLFADGIEQDFLHFDWGVTASVGISQRTLNLVQYERR